VASRLNALFTAQGMRLSAADDAGTLRIAGLDYGGTPSFTVAYASTGGNDVAAMLGIGTTGVTTTVNNGLDVQGSFTQGVTTYTATGDGQWLTGDDDTAVEGLRIAYSGTANAASGHIDYTAGLGGLAARFADAVSRSGDGLAAAQNNLLQIQIDAMNARADSIQSRIDSRREALLKQFTAMESALSALQAQGSSLASSINSLQSLNK
jgi:flagellar hook-associated protein 2